jgi:hypothetical protein
MDGREEQRAPAGIAGARAVLGTDRRFLVIVKQMTPAMPLAAGYVGPVTDLGECPLKGDQQAGGYLAGCLGLQWFLAPSFLCKGGHGADERNSRRNETELDQATHKQTST